MDSNNLKEDAAEVVDSHARPAVGGLATAAGQDALHGVVIESDRSAPAVRLSRLNEGLFTSLQNNFETPPELFKALDKYFHFTLDAAASDDNHLCPRYYTEETDGLAQSWKDEVVFLNCPYSDVKRWTEKAAWESRLNGATVVMLLPARTDTKWWQENVMPFSEHIAYIPGRLTFLVNGQPVRNKKTGQIQTAPFPSALVLFRKPMAQQMRQAMMDFVCDKPKYAKEEEHARAA